MTRIARRCSRTPSHDLPHPRDELPRFEPDGGGVDTYRGQQAGRTACSRMQRAPMDGACISALLAAA